MSKNKCPEQLMLLQDWINWRFVIPIDIKKAQRMCKNGHVPAKKIGKEWFVIVNLELIQTGDPIADEMISDVLRAA